MVKQKIIKSFSIRNNNYKPIAAGGETRRFYITGEKNAVFDIEILNEDGYYYNFSTKTFSSTYSNLNSAVLAYNKYKLDIKFPPVSDDDHYDILLYANPNYNTKLATGMSDSLIYKITLQQLTDVTLTLTSISPNTITAFGSMSTTTDSFVVSRGANSTGKVPFKVTTTAAVTRNFSINRQPVQNDIVTYVTRTIGSAAIPIGGEDISSSTYYKWPLDNVAGLKEGMFIANGTNITVGTQIKSYEDSFDIETRSKATSVVETKIKKETTKIQPLTAYAKEIKTDRYIPKSEKIEKSVTIESYSKTEEVPNEIIKTRNISVFEPAIQKTGEPVINSATKRLTSQSGNVVFSHQQADALKDDNIKVYGYGPNSIESLSGYLIELSDLKVELTEVTTTVDGAVSNNTSVTVDERAGIRDGDFSTVTGIGIDTSSAIPTVTSGAGAVNGGGALTLSAAQTLEDGITLTFGGASRIATITGNINIIKAGDEDVTLRFDLERFLTAV